MAQEVSQLLGRFLQNFHPGQVHQTEMIRFFPVEAAAGNDQHTLFFQEIQGELAVAGDIEFLHIDLGEDVESSLGLYRTDSGNIVQRLVDEFPLLVDSATGNDVLIDTLVAAQSRLDDGLAGDMEHRRILDSILMPEI